MTCPKCKGQGGWGTFGPCPVGSIHYKRPCMLCGGQCNLPIGANANSCGACQSMGGMGTFGPCEVGSVHYKSDCSTCCGKGYSLIYSSGYPSAPTNVSYANGGYSSYPSSGMNVNVSVGMGGMNASMGMGGMPGSGMGMPMGGSGMGMPMNGGMGMGGGMPMGGGMGMGGGMPMGGGMGMGMGMPMGGGMGMGMGMKGHSLIPAAQSRGFPMNCVSGQQSDGVPVACAIAHTQHGDIPGKAKDGTCWYPYGGGEHTTSNFSWIVVPGYRLERAHGNHVPHGAVSAGFQNDGAGALFLAVSQGPHGSIPGKAKSGTCWYPYGGKEHSTNNFMYVCQ